MLGTSHDIKTVGFGATAREVSFHTSYPYRVMIRWHKCLTLVKQKLLNLYDGHHFTHLELF